MRTLILVLALAGIPALAQDKQQERIKKIFTLKYADPRQVAQVIDMFGEGGGTRANFELRTLSVVANASAMSAIEEAIAKLDVAPDQRNVELTVYYITAGAREGMMSGGPIPAELGPVTAQLQKAFAFKQYNLLETIFVRTRPSQLTEASSSIAGKLAPSIAQFKVKVSGIGPDGVVHIDLLNAGLRYPTSSNDKGGFIFSEVGVSTAVDIKEGQKIVLGKSGLQGPDAALFLVLTAKIVQ
jgi:hypothetical protein